MSKAIKLEDKCPKCDSHLIIRDGEYGEFLACPRFPSCKFTRSLPDRDLKIYQPPSPYCKKCNHTGLIPFIKDRKTIPNVFLFCECYYEQERAYFRPYTSDMFDFPVSYNFYQSLCYEHGWQDPGPDKPKERTETTKPSEPEWSWRQQDTVEQLRAEVRGWREKHSEILLAYSKSLKKKPKSKYD